MKKKMSAIPLIMLAIAIVAGCSSNSNSGQKTETPSKTDGKDQIELTFLALSEWSEPMNTFIQAFEAENPNIKIKFNTMPFRQLFENVEVQMSSKKPDFDVFFVDGPLISNYAVKGYLEPLDPYLDAGAKDKWIQSSVDAGSYNGQLVAAPMNTSSAVLFYNKDIFAAKNVTAPSSDTASRWTWEQVVEAGKKLTYSKSGGAQPDVFGFSFDQVSRPYQILPLANSLGAKVISDNGIVATGYTNSPEMVQAAQFYSDMFNNWKISPKITPDLAPDYFASGKVAMFVGGTWNMETFVSKGINFGIAPHPYFEGKNVATPTGSWHVAISKYSAKKEAAAKFVNYITYGPGSKMWFEGHNDVPALKELIDSIGTDAKFEAFPQNIMRLAAYEALNTAVPRPSTPGYLEWETLVNNAFEDIKNGSDPKKSLDNAASEIDAQLKKYESLVK